MKKFTDIPVTTAYSNGSSVAKDIFQMINGYSERGFSFYRYARLGDETFEDSKEINYNGEIVTDIGAFYMITPKQYIIGINSEFGLGPHLDAFARAMYAIKTGKNIVFSMDKEIVELKKETRLRGYLTGRITYTSNQGGIFNISIPEKISPSIFSSFEAFYNDYNEQIKDFCSKYEFRVSVSCDKVRTDTDNLDFALEELRKRIDPSLEKDDDEVIIGKATGKKMAL